VAAEVAPLATASGWREAGEEMRGVKGVNSAGADWRVGSGDCLGTGLGLELGFPGWEEGEGPEPRTGEVPLKVEGEEEVTFFMNFFILPFIMTAGDGETAAATAERALVERGFGRVDAVTRSGLLGGRDGRGRCRGRGEAYKWGSKKAGGVHFARVPSLPVDRTEARASRCFGSGTYSCGGN
jgi:hypothetical protein